MAWVLRARTKEGVTKDVSLGQGAQLKLEPGTSYELLVQGTVPSKPITIKRVAKKNPSGRQDLVAEQDGQVILTVKDYFGADDGTLIKLPGGDSCPQDGTTLTGMTQAQASSEIVWSSGEAACAPVRAADDSSGGAGGWGGLAALGGLGLAAGGGGGGGSAAVPSVLNQVSVGFVGGPAIEGHGLSVQLFAADGVTALGQGALDASGRVLLSVGSYQGVVIVRITDASSGHDYNDEVVGPKDLNAELWAMGEIVAANSIIYLNINVLTSIAYNKADLMVAANQSYTTEIVNGVNGAVAQAVGLEDLHNTTIVPTNSPDYDPTGTLSQGELYGRLLAYLSGIDSTNSGNTQTTIDAFVGANPSDGLLSISSSGSTMTGALTTAGTNALTAGANAVALPEVSLSAIAFDNEPDLDVSLSSQVVTATLSAALQSDERLMGSLDGGATWVNITSSVTGTALSWPVTITSSGTLMLRVIDAEDNQGPLASEAYVFSGTIPTTTISGIDITDDTGTDGDFITSDASSTITATLSEPLSGGNVLKGSVDGGATWTDITGSVSGAAVSWSTTLLSGAQQIRLRVESAAGNPAPAATQSYTLDTSTATPTITSVADDVSPVTGNLTTGGATNDTTLTLTGTAEANSTVTIYNNGTTVLGTATTNSSGEWSLTTSTLTNGTTYSLTAKATDVAGNESLSSSAFGVTVDTTAPAAPTVSSLTATSLRPTLTGTATLSSDEVLTVSVNGVSYSVSAPGGNWSLDLATATPIGGGGLIAGLADGTYSVTATVTDAAGNSTSDATSNELTVEALAAVSSVAITGQTGAVGGILNVGDTVTVTVTMTKSVVVTGTPKVALNVGGTSVDALYQSGSGSANLVFQYTVGAGMTDANGISINANSLSLNSGTILDTGVAAILTHAAVADNAGYKVDTTSPTVSLETTTFGLFSSEQGLTDLYASRNHVDPDVARLPNGSYVLVWEANDTGPYIAVQRFDASGNILGSQVRLNGPNLSSDLRLPHVTSVGGSGEFVVAWGYNAGNSVSPNWDAYVQKFDASGVAIDSPVRLGDLTTTYSNVTTDYQIVALGSDGSYAVVWNEASATGFNIYAQRFDGDNVAVGSIISFDGDFYDFDFDVEAVGSSGAFAVAWEAGGDHRVHAQLVDASGDKGALYTSVRGTSTTNMSGFFPEIFALNDGKYGMVWTGYASGSVNFQLFNADGSVSGSVTSWTPTLPPGYTQYPVFQNPEALMINSSGDFVLAIVGQNQSPGYYDVFVQKYNASGVAQGSLITLSEVHSLISPPSLNLVQLVGGDYVLTWWGAESASGDFSVFVQQVRADGTLVGNNVKLESPTRLDGQDKEPWVEALSDGGYVVAWQGQDGNPSYAANSTSVYAQRFSSSGETVSFTSSFASNSLSASVESTEAGKAYLVKSTESVASVTAIEALANSLWNEVTIASVSSPTSLPLTGLANGAYTLYAADAAGNLSSPFATNIVIG